MLRVAGSWPKPMCTGLPQLYEIGRGRPGRGRPSHTLAVPSLSNWEAVSLLSQDKIGSSPAQMLHWGKGRKRKILERDPREEGKHRWSHEDATPPHFRHMPLKKRKRPESYVCSICIAGNGSSRTPLASELWCCTSHALELWVKSTCCFSSVSMVFCPRTKTG